MRKETIRFVVKSENGVVTNIGKSIIYQPPVNFKGGSVKWFDDSKLIKKTNKWLYADLTVERGEIEIHMRFEYLRKYPVSKSNYLAFANIDIAEVIADITDDDLILELDATGIILNRFVPNSAERNETKIVLWINLESEEISVQRTGFSKFHNEKYIEDIEFSLSGLDEMALIEYIQR